MSGGLNYGRIATKLTGRLNSERLINYNAIIMLLS